MAGELEFRIEIEATADVWTEVTDTHAPSGLMISYGIQGNRPLDLVASTGQCQLVLRNDDENSGSLEGLYSPLHANVLSGWTVGLALRVVFHRTVDVAQSVSGITRSGSTATATTAAPHGYATDDWITIALAAETEYNGTFKITKTGASTFTYTVAGTPGTPAAPEPITARLAYVKHRGKIGAIIPDAGTSPSALGGGTRRVSVTSYDGMRDLAEADVREVDLQVNKSESELMTALIAAIPAASRPVSQSFDAGVDTFPYAFDDIGQGTKALSVIQDVMASSFALAFMRGDGQLIMQSRHTRGTGASKHTFLDTEMHELFVPADLSRLWNLIRVTIRPREVDDAATTVVYSTVGSPVVVTPGQTVTIIVEYRDPDETRTLIGALDVVDPLVAFPTADADYEGNSAEDGTGSDLTSDLTVTITPWASSAKLEVTNTGASTVYLVSSGAQGPAQGEAFLQIRGKGVYNLGPQTYEATSVQGYGTRQLNLNLKYQGDAAIAQSYASYLEVQYSTLIAQLSVLTFIASESDDLLKQAMAREPGDIITLTEAVTGLTLIEAVITSVDLEIRPGPFMVCRLGLGPAAPFQSWLLGIVGRGELGQRTRLGF